MTLPAAPFVLRPFRPSDAEEFGAAVRASPSVCTWMSWARPDFSADDARKWFAWCEESRANGTAHEFAIVSADGELVGGAGLNQFNPTHRFGNLGYWVRESAQRRGAASAAIHMLAQYAFEELKLARAEIVVAVGNEASVAAARKAGALHEGVARNRLQLHGQPVDAHVLSLTPPAGR
ncbi:N-acetyltransferase [Massilia arenosa]|uniref:N-acetyltransferase n=1 Tax=Zemynaea arenosa TaxID=2561931 RepID=A0A4Y9S7D7_9BURK|nr:GNAT family N-acetyltransferase [Massilia arenosa]TFW15438.1 N-acetyltransferase [Massilia arenosa]